MKQLHFKTKVLILVVVPLMIISISLTLLSFNQAHKLGRQNIATFSETIFDLRRVELKNYTELALSAVKHVREDQSLSNSEAQRLAKKIYKDMSFGEDGYFFVYDYDGINLAHPKKPQLEGKNLWDLKDSDGFFLIRSLVSKAQNDGGYTEYIWDKPSKGRDVGKIGYSLGYDDWKWMIGTGLYVDDLAEAMTNVDEEVGKSLASTLQIIAAFSVGFTLLVGAVGARFTLSEGKLADERLQQLSRKVVVSQEEERSRVARDLQKKIGRALVVARTKLGSLTKGKEIHADS